MTKQPKKTITVLKDKDLVMISNNITLVQRKAYNALLYNATKELFKNNNTNTFKIDVMELERLTQIDITKREQLRTELKGLMQTVIEFVNPNNKYFQMSVLVSYIEYKEGYIYYELTNFLCQMLLNAPKPYAILDLLQISNFTSKFSVALYEFIKTKTKFIPEMELTEFRRLIVGDLKLYEEIKNLKARVLDVATKEITEKTNLDVTYELISYRGLKYTHIQLHVTEKKFPETEDENKVEKLDEKISAQLFEQINKIDEMVSLRFEGIIFYKEGTTLIVKTPFPHINQWLIDNHFINKIKHILFNKLNNTDFANVEIR